MDKVQETAEKYAQRHGLFHSHGHDTFSAQNCLASIQACDRSVSESIKEDFPSDDIDFPQGSIKFDEELLTEGVQDEPGVSLQTGPPFSYPSDSLHSLLLELPDMGLSPSIDFRHLSGVLGFVACDWLAAQYLPLISVDQNKDEGLDFPPHVDRLHQALQYKADHEHIDNFNALHNTVEHEVKSEDEVFCIRENTLTPRQSPRCSHSCTLNSSLIRDNTDEPQPARIETLRSEAKKQRISISYDEGEAESQVPHLEPEAAAVSKCIAEEAVAIAADGGNVEAVSAGIEESSLDFDGRSDPSDSHFDDAFFVSNEHEDAEDVQMQSIASILDRIDNLLIPLPIIPISIPDHITTDWLSMLGTLNWEHHKQPVPLNVDASLEAALPWAPLPPRRSCQFDQEAVEGPGECPATHVQETTQELIAVMGSIEDVEIEECTESKEPTKPQPPSKNSLDSMIRLRLQRAASERATPQSSSRNLPLRSKTPKPILPSADDPGATSKLVSAFMTLRGVKKPRAHRR